MDKKNLTVEDITAIKLMEEIHELDQEIKLKQKWINTRVKLLHEINKKKSDRSQLIDDFLQRIQPEYPSKLSVEYKGPFCGDAIPMGWKDKYDFSIPMDNLGEGHMEGNPTITEENGQ